MNCGLLGFPERSVFSKEKFPTGIDLSEREIELLTTRRSACLKGIKLEG